MILTEDDFHFEKENLIIEPVTLSIDDARNVYASPKLPLKYPEDLLLQSLQEIFRRALLSARSEISARTEMNFIRNNKVSITAGEIRRNLVSFLGHGSRRKGRPYHLEKYFIYSDLSKLFEDSFGVPAKPRKEFYAFLSAFMEKIEIYVDYNPKIPKFKNNLKNIVWRKPKREAFYKQFEKIARFSRLEDALVRLTLAFDADTRANLVERAPKN